MIFATIANLAIITEKQETARHRVRFGVHQTGETMLYLETIYGFPPPYLAIAAMLAIVIAP